MKFAGSCLIAGALLFSMSARSQDGSVSGGTADVADKPYATIVARNMFGLLPIPPPDTNPPAPPVDPPPKITPNGIMTIFGRDQALFKVATKPKPGQPAKEDSYVLGEGERQDDVEIVKIDRQGQTITFNNHGVIQELALVEASSSGPSGGPGGGPGQPSALPGNMRAGSMSAADRAALFRGRQSGNPNFNNAGNSAQSNLGGNTGGYGQQPAAQLSEGDIEDRVMSAAQQMAQMELNRMATQDQVDQGKLPPLPPTPLTPKEATGIGGMPLSMPAMPPLPGR